MLDILSENVRWTARMRLFLDLLDLSVDRLVVVDNSKEGRPIYTLVDKRNNKNV